MSWRYFAQRLTRTGPGAMLDLELPLTDVSLTDALSGPDQGSAVIPVEFLRLKDDRGQPLLREWGTAIYAEADGLIRHGGILAHSGFDGPSWNLEWTGFTGYALGLPYLDSIYSVQEDPLNIVRHIWGHIQSVHSPLGLVLDGTTSPVRIGTELEQVDFDTQSGPVSFESGPHKLNWWSTHDLGREVDSLAKETPFDYTEEHAWAGSTIEHRMRLWYPRKSVRRHNLRFVLGENVTVTPSVEYNGDEFANAALGLGAGEGRDMVRSPIIADEQDDRLRRVVVIADKGLRSIREVTSLAQRELVRRLDLGVVESVTVRQHPHADITTIQTGDEILLQAETGWVDVQMWVRVLSRTFTPDSGDFAELSVEKAA